MSLEHGIQQACLTYLGMLRNQNRVYFLRNNSFAGFVDRANGSKGYIKNVAAGSPDILVCTDKGRFLGLEIKGPSGRQSPVQREVEAEIRALGGDYILIRDVQQLIDYFD